MEVVTGAVGILRDKLAELLKEEYGLQQGVREKIESLSRELNMVHAVLREVGDVPWHRLDTPTKLWVGELREASYDMEDIVDAFLVRHGTEPPDPRRRKPFGKKVSELWNQMREFWARREISTKIQDLSKKLEELAVMRSKYKLDSDITNSAAATTIDPRILSLHKKATELVGIEGSKDELINMLSLGGNVDVSAEKMKIVTVVGLGGLGKTTLAKAVYDQFKPRFECGAFVPVGLKPCMKKVLRDILIGLDGETYRKPEWDVLDVYQLIDKLKEFVREKRCFLVIDDIWDRKSWEYIRCALQESNCSRVVITTRIDEVATHAGEVYRIKKLSHENSKKLLYARISDGGGKYFGSPSSSEACDRILKKCDGVPLAIITIASVLASKPEQHWDEVNNFISVGREDNDEMSNTRTILSFSYYDLPSHLKPCLLYLSVFPEDHVIEKNRLIWMWTAEGFIHGEQAAREGLFDLGERYFNELINRNMIQAEEEEGYVYGCRVHDMVLDLIRSLSSEQNFVTVLEQEQQRLPVSIIPRRLALQHANSEPANINNVQKLRSLIVSRGEGELGSACKRIPCLRVLDMESCDAEGKLEYLGNLLQLRYLRLWCTNKLLLGQVRYLKCLRTLDLCGRAIEGVELLEEVGLLTQLVCLRVFSNFGIRVPAGLIGRLTSLQELSMDCYFITDDLMQFVKELGMLRELRVLRIEIWHQIEINKATSESVEKALLVSLGNMHNIRTVHIDMDKNSGMSHAGFISLRHLQYLHLRWIVCSGLLVWLPPNLCSLAIEVRDVKEQDMEALARLPELCYVNLKVRSPDAELLSIKIPTGAGYFRKLRILRIWGPSFIWFDLHASECSSSSRVASIIMPSLESFTFDVHVRSLKDATRLGYDDKLLGFENLGRTSLRRVSVLLRCTGARVSEVEEMAAVLVHACGVHPKRPTLNIRYFEETEMLSPYQEASDMNIANKAWNLAAIIDSGDIRALHMPDPAVSSCKVMRLHYTNKGDYRSGGRSLWALSSNAVHKLWKWEQSNRNPLGMATTSVPPQLWQPENGILMANDTTDVNPEDATACSTLYEDVRCLISASGGKITVFDMDTFRNIITFAAPPPAVTFLAVYPKDSIIAVGMEDSSIQIYNFKYAKAVTIQKVLQGRHTKKISGLAFSQSMGVLVSSGADAQLCVWSIDGWENKESRYIQPPSKNSGPLVGDTMVQFHYDQTRLLVVHESQVAIYDGKLKFFCSWFPRDALPAPVSSAVYSSDGLLVYVGFHDGAIGIFEAESLRLQCRIAPTAYIPSSLTSCDGIIYPVVVAANPWKPNQLAVGMSDGAVHVLEPLDTDAKVGTSVSRQ